MDSSCQFLIQGASAGKPEGVDVGEAPLNNLHKRKEASPHVAITADLMAMSKEIFENPNIPNDKKKQMLATILSRVDEVKEQKQAMKAHMSVAPKMQGLGIHNHNTTGHNAKTHSGGNLSHVNSTPLGNSRGLDINPNESATDLVVTNTNINRNSTNQTRSKSAGNTRTNKRTQSPEIFNKNCIDNNELTLAPNLSKSFLHRHSPTAAQRKEHSLENSNLRDNYSSLLNDFSNSLVLNSKSGGIQLPSRQIREQMKRIVQNLTNVHNDYIKFKESVLTGNYNVLEGVVDAYESNLQRCDNNGEYSPTSINDYIPFHNDTTGIIPSENSVASTDLANDDELTRTSIKIIDALLTDKDRYALKVGRQVLGGALSNSRGGADTRVQYAYELDKLQQEEAVSRFFFDSWIARSGRGNRNGAAGEKGSASADVKTIEILAEMQKSINKAQAEEFNKSIAGLDEERQSDLNNRVDKSGGYIPYLSAVGLHALDRLIYECGNSNPVLNEIKSSILPSVYPDFEALGDMPNDSQGKDVHDSSSKYLNIPTWFQKYQENLNAQAPLYREIDQLKLILETNNAEIRNKNQAIVKLESTIDSLRKENSSYGSELKKSNKIGSDALEELKDLKKVSRQNEVRMQNEIEKSAGLLKDTQVQIQKMLVERRILDKEVEVLRARDFPDLKERFKEKVAELEALQDKVSGIEREKDSYRMMVNEFMTEKGNSLADMKKLLIHAKSKLTNWYKCCAVEKSLAIKDLVPDESSYDSSKGFNLVSLWFRSLCDDIVDYETELCGKILEIELKKSEIIDIEKARKAELESKETAHKLAIQCMEDKHQKLTEDLHNSYKLKLNNIEMEHSNVMHDLKKKHENVVLEMRKTLSGLEYMVTNITDKLKQANLLTSSLKDDISQLNEQISSQKAYIVKREEEIEAKSLEYQANIDNLIDNLQAKQAELDHANVVLISKFNEIEQFKSEIAVKNKKIADLERENNKLSNQIQKSEEKIMKLESNNSDLKQDILKLELAAVQREEEFRNEIEKVMKSLASSEELVTNLRGDVVLLQVKIESLSADLADLKNQFSAQTDLLLKKEELVSKMKSEYEDLANAVSQNNSDSLRLVEELNKSSEDLMKSNVFYEHSVISCEDGLAYLQRDLDEKIKTIEDQSDRINSSAVVYTSKLLVNLQDEDNCSPTLVESPETGIFLKGNCDENVNIGNERGSKVVVDDLDHYSTINNGIEGLKLENERLKMEVQQLEKIIEKYKQGEDGEEFNFRNVDGDYNERDRFENQSPTMAIEDYVNEGLNSTSVDDTVQSADTNTMTKTVATMDSFDTTNQLNFEKEFMSMLADNNPSLLQMAGVGVGDSLNHFQSPVALSSANASILETGGSGTTENVIAGDVMAVDEALFVIDKNPKQSSVDRIRGLAKKLRTSVTGPRDDDSLQNANLPRGNPFKLVQPFIAFIQGNEKRLARENGKLSVLLREAHDIMVKLIGDLTMLQMKEQDMLSSSTDISKKEKIWRSIYEMKRGLVDNLNVLFDDQSMAMDQLKKGKGLNTDMKVATLLKLHQLYIGHRKEQQQGSSYQRSMMKVNGVPQATPLKSNKVDNDVVEVLDDIVSNFKTSIKIAGGFKTQLFNRSGDIDPFTVDTIIRHTTADYGDKNNSIVKDVYDVKVEFTKPSSPPKSPVSMKENTEEERMDSDKSRDDDAFDEHQIRCDDAQSLDDSLTVQSRNTRFENEEHSHNAMGKNGNIDDNDDINNINNINNNYDNDIISSLPNNDIEDGNNGLQNAFSDLKKQLDEAITERDALKSQVAIPSELSLEGASLRQQLADLQIQFEELQAKYESGINSKGEVKTDEQALQEEAAALAPINETFAVAFDDWSPSDQIDIFREIIKFQKIKQEKVLQEKQSLVDMNNMLKSQINLEQVKIEKLKKEINILRNAKDDSEIEKNFSIYKKVKRDILTNVYADYNRKIDPKQKTIIHDVIYQEQEIVSISNCVIRVISILNELADISQKSAYKPRSLVRHDSKNAKVLKVSPADMFSNMNLELSHLEEKEADDANPNVYDEGDGIGRGEMAFDSFAQLDLHGGQNANDSITLDLTNNASQNNQTEYSGVHPNVYTTSVLNLLQPVSHLDNIKSKNMNVNDSNNQKVKKLDLSAPTYEFDEMSEGSMNVIDNFNITQKLTEKMKKARCTSAGVTRARSDAASTRPLGTYNSHIGLNMVNNRRMTNKNYDLSIQPATKFGGSMTSKSSMNTNYDLLLNAPLKPPKSYNFDSSQHSQKGNKAPASALRSFVETSRRSSELSVYKPIKQGTIHGNTGGADHTSFYTAENSMYMTKQLSSDSSQGNKVDVSLLQRDLATACEKLSMRYMLIDVDKFRMLKDELASISELNNKYATDAELLDESGAINATTDAPPSVATQNKANRLVNTKAAFGAGASSIEGLQPSRVGSVVDRASNATMKINGASSDVQEYFRMVNAKMNNHLEAANNYLEILDECTAKYVFNAHDV